MAPGVYMTADQVCFEWRPVASVTPSAAQSGYEIGTATLSSDDMVEPTFASWYGDQGSITHLDTNVSGGWTPLCLTRGTMRLQATRFAARTTVVGRWMVWARKTLASWQDRVLLPT